MKFVLVTRVFLLGLIVLLIVGGLGCKDDCRPKCLDKECGDNGCGSVCGTCTAPDTCNEEGVCGCSPDCINKDCGNDGCNGSCGDCDPTLSCDNLGHCMVAGDGVFGDICIDYTDCAGNLNCLVFEDPFDAYCAPQCTCDTEGECPTTGYENMQVDCAWAVDGAVNCWCGFGCKVDNMQGDHTLCPNQGDEWTCKYDGYDAMGSSLFYCIPCTPDCTNRACGPDGCEGYCGDCNANQVCDATGQCVAEGALEQGDFCTADTDCQALFDCLEWGDYYDRLCSYRCECFDGTGCPVAAGGELQSVCLFSDSERNRCWCGYDCKGQGGGPNISMCPNDGDGWACVLLRYDASDESIWGCKPVK